MRRSKALAIALFAALVALVSLTGSANAGTGAVFAVGDRILKADGTGKHTVKTVDNFKDSARAKHNVTGAAACFTDVQPAGYSATTSWRLRTVTGPKLWKYPCSTPPNLRQAKW